MDSPIAPSAMRRTDDGPAYDLVSLGLVVFTILLVGIWVSRFFREPAPDRGDFNRVLAQLENDKSTGQLTAAAHLEAARWADFNLKGPDDSIPQEFQDHLKMALDAEETERAALESRAGKPDEEVRNEAAATLAEEFKDGAGPAGHYFEEWVRRHRAWLASGDITSFNVSRHMELARLFANLGRHAQAIDEIENVFRASPDLARLASENLEKWLKAYKFTDDDAGDLSLDLQNRWNQRGIK